MIRELVDYNLRRGSASLRSDVRHLLCLMSNNNSSATDELIDMLTRRVVNAVNTHLSNPDFVSLLMHFTFFSYLFPTPKHHHCRHETFLLPVERAIQR